MHSFLRSIGFSEYDNKKVKALLDDIVKRPDSKKLVSWDGDSIRGEYRKIFAGNTGIAVCGDYTEEDGFEREYYFPFCVPYHVSTVSMMEMQRHIFTEAASGICDDYKVGVSLIFFLQNQLASGSLLKRDRKEVMTQISLSALSVSGRILMPLKKSKEEVARTSKATNRRIRLISKAMDGNEEAMEELTVSDMENNEQLMDMVKCEDIYTLVDTYFMPGGADCELYSVMGEIEEVREATNNLTNEEIYIITILCNDLHIEVCINKKDLLGEPAPRRRYKGDIWLQGVCEPV